jgi:hypothetical protein
VPRHYSALRRAWAGIAGITLPSYDALEWGALNARVDEVLWLLEDSPANAGLVRAVQGIQDLSGLQRSAPIRDKLYEVLVSALDAVECFTKENSDE